VSQADRDAEVAIIHLLREHTPEFGIVAEETGGKNSGLATWYIDPLDGTTNFLNGIPHYAVSIALVAHVGSDADDPIACAVEIELLSDSIPTRPETTRHRFAHDRHPRSGRVVVRGEVAPGKERNSERLKIAGHDDQTHGGRRVRPRDGGPAAHVEGREVAIVA